MSGQPFRARFGFDADGNRIIDVGDPVRQTDAVNLRSLLANSGLRLVGRLGDLPNPADPDPLKRPNNGQAYLVQRDLAGNTIDRLVVFDTSLAPTGPVAKVAVLEPTADQAAIAAAAGTTDPGVPFDLPGPGGGTGAVLDYTANANGTVSALVTTWGTGYRLGDTLVRPAGSFAWPGMTGNTTVTVTALAGASATGSWRFISLHDWIKPLAGTPDHKYGMVAGDLQATTEPNHEELKAFDGTSWRLLFSTDTVKGWIASLALFEGTVREVGGTVVPGTVELTALPDLTDKTPAVVAAAAGKVGHYWVWTGGAGYTVKPTDPRGVGRDLAPAQFQVGDWLQLANRGVAPAVDLHWVVVGGDLLARTRADALFGLRTWAAGNYEKGTLITHKGSIYRAIQGVLPADTAPGTKAVTAVTGVPAGPGGVPPQVLPVTGVKAAPWELVPLSAGVQHVPTDTDLPATAPAEDVYLVLTSANNGGKAALYSYDPGAGKWMPLGSGGVGLHLTGGKQLVSVGMPVGAISQWPTATPPPGWLLCHGQDFTAADYPELALVLPALKVPDYRGSYLRGAGLNITKCWGDPFAVAGDALEDSTKMPVKPFTATTDKTGDHKHLQGYRTTSTNYYEYGWKALGKYAPVSSNGGSAEADLAYTSTAEAHKHIVTIKGGDAETRPKTFLIEHIIKATDIAMVARP